MYYPWTVRSRSPLVVEMVKIYSCDAMNEFLGNPGLAQEGLQHYRVHQDETFQDMVVRQSGKLIKIHLDNYVKDLVADKYAEYIKTPLRPKKLLISGYAVQQVANHVEIEDAEDDGALHCGGQVLLSIDDCEVLYLRALQHHLDFAQKKPTRTTPRTSSG
jgi:hypothetical protein